MAKSSVGRDPFARGEFERTSCGPGKCAWCGERRRVVYTYVWISDGLHRRPSIFHQHQADHAFCNFSCFKSYHS